MSHRNCDTTKHRKLREKQRQNRLLRMQTATPEEQEAMVAAANPSKPEYPICPLCQKPITGDWHIVEVNQEKVVVHETCP